jgi:hypothetical protein
VSPVSRLNDFASSRHIIPGPDDCALVSTSGYLITNLAANKLPLPPKAEWALWYQYYFATERGELGLTQYRHDLGELSGHRCTTWG